MGRGKTVAARALLWIFCILGALLLLVSPRVALAQSASNLLAGARPALSQGLSSSERLTDGVVAFDGDTWKTPLSTRFADFEAFASYDLGEERRVVALFLQGDNNDRYEVSVSNDGRRFEPIWVAGEHRGGGVQVRVVKGLEARGRYLRLRPVSGDAALAVTELQAFSELPSTFPPELSRRAGVPLDRRVRDRTLVFGLSLIFALVLVRAGSGAAGFGLALFAVLAAGYALGSALQAAWPVSNREVSLLRAVVAVVAGSAVLRLGFSPPRHPVHRPFTTSILALSAFLSVAAFYNLGHPQFYDAGQNRPTFAHYFDLRQYYTSAKYFRELGYEGTYEADVLAFSEDTGQSLASLAKTRMRDLYSLRDSNVGAQRARIEARRRHFTPERFEQYRADARFFREAMGNRSYLDTLQDFGANATPFWMSIAHALFSALPPSNFAFTVTGSFDLLLLLFTLVVIGRSFGLVAALVCAVVFGANDFVMYGTNWGGATLRHDWLFCLGLGVCAIRRERFVLGGALLGVSTMIRAFPALALLGIALTMAWAELDAYLGTRRRPTRAEFLERHRAALRVLLGALGFALFALALAWLVLPAASWIDWYAKVALGDAEPHPATLGLRVLFGGSEYNQASVLRARLPIYAAAVVLFAGAVALACRGRRLEHSAVLGLVLVPVVFSPAPYYLHLVYLLPLLAFQAQARGPLGSLSSKAAATVLPLLVLCALQYLAVPISDWGLHFALENALLFVALGALLFLFEFERLSAFLFQPARAKAERGPE